MPSALWTERRETALNWLALGLLLAAWNAVDDPGPADCAVADAGSAEPRASAATPVDRRPESLRGHSYVTVRSLVSHDKSIF